MTSRSLTIRVGFRQILGQREVQEDFGSLWRQDGDGSEAGPALAVVADGMGGHAAGEQASRIATTEFIRSFQVTRAPIGQRLNTALENGNLAVGSASAQDPNLKGMGCTLVAAYVDTAGLRWASIGDSSLLLYRSRRLDRLNDNHSYGAFLDRQAVEGIISDADARDNPRRHSLRAAITGGALTLKDIHDEPFQLQNNDIVVLATDGLDVLSAAEIITAIETNIAAGPDAIAWTLVSRVEAMRVPNQDNTTVLVLSVADSGQAAVAPSQTGSEPYERTQPYRPQQTALLKPLPKLDPEIMAPTKTRWGGLIAGAMILLAFAAGYLLGTEQDPPVTINVPAPKPALRDQGFGDRSDGSVHSPMPESAEPKEKTEQLEQQPRRLEAEPSSTQKLNVPLSEPAPADAQRGSGYLGNGEPGAAPAQQPPTSEQPAKARQNESFGPAPGDGRSESTGPTKPDVVNEPIGPDRP